MTTIDPVVAGLLEQLSAAPDFADMPVENAREFCMAFIQMEGEAEDVASITARTATRSPCGSTRRTPRAPGR
jgi:hypothetical protein